MKTDACVDAGYEKLILPEFGDERDTVGVARAWRTAAIRLRKSVRYCRLPRAEIQFLLCPAGFLH